MQRRRLGKTGLEVSALSFGCGAVGGLMTRGAPADQERAVARAIDAGLTYFDTAPQYGSGTSEENIGRILAKLEPKVVLGTKVRVSENDYGRIESAIVASCEASLKRLGRDSVDLFQLHNRIVATTAGDGLSADTVLGEVVPAMQKLRQQGKVRFIGITALGETAALHRIAKSGAFDTAQVCYNALNPSAGPAVAKDYPAQNYEQLLARTGKAGMGTIGIRVLAGGALSGSAERHPLATQNVEPIGSAFDFGADVARAQRFAPLVAAGHGADLVEIALRFALAEPGLSTVLIGLATIEHLERAIAAAEKGPLPAEALARMREIQASFAGEAR
jgi:aryl-alcohol dehydrogenase-like predicted oxidoreductase